MKQKLLKILILILLPSIAIYQQVAKDTIRLFCLGGQSNIDGYRQNTELPNSFKSEFKNLWIFHGNPDPDEKENGELGRWDVLKPRHGVVFSSEGINNKLSDRFGIELSFAKKAVGGISKRKKCIN